jgi:hypothetical protein
MSQQTTQSEKITKRRQIRQIFEDFRFELKDLRFEPKDLRFDTGDLNLC